MSKKILIFSTRTDDFEFGQLLGKELEREVCLVATSAEAQKILLEEPTSLILWDAESPDEFEKMAKKITRPLPPSRIAIATDKPLQNYPKLFEYPIFGYHLIRKYNPLAAQVVARVLNAGVTPKATALERFFPESENVQVQRIQLTSSAHKTPAVEAVRNFLVKLGIPDRLAIQIAGAADELLMNAIFDAPVLKDGTRYRRDTDRNAAFELEAKVSLAFAETKNYATISIADNFGSLNREQIMYSLRKDYRQKAYQMRGVSTAPALGVTSIVLSGLSILYVARPKLNTEVILFFPKVKTVLEFHSSFSFFGIIGV